MYITLNCPDYSGDRKISAARRTRLPIGNGTNVALERVNRAIGAPVPIRCPRSCSSGSPRLSLGRRTSGFTLIELMVTIAVAAVLLMIALPSLRDFILNNRLASVTNDLVGDLALARAEAIRRGSRVTVCASNDAGSSGPTCSGTDWSAGRLIFSDAITAKTIDTGDERLRAYDGSGSGITLTSNSVSHNEYVQYRPSGATDASAAISFKFCDSRNKGRTVTVALNGQVTTTGESGTTCP
ncbi:MAG: GspH/FimT family pseudopilin [Rhodocyclaceae bacterium]